MRSALLVCMAAACLATFAAPLCVSPDYALRMRGTPAPEVRNRTVVILGSSTAEGVGASSQSASWAGRLAQQLAKSGIRVINRSIAGANTTDSLERFDRDVVPYQPGFVILATSIVNEGFESSPAVAYERYNENTTALIGRVREIGAIPMNITMYPVSRYKWEHLALVSQLTESARTMELATL